METGFCPHCERMSELSLLKRSRVVRVKKAEVAIEEVLHVCRVCKNEFATEEQEEANIAKAYEAYRKRENLLSPAAIRSLRRRYGLSQSDFSTWLGWGKITVHRYENGALPDAAHNELLWLLAKPHNAKELLERNGRNLDEGALRMLKAKVSEQLASEGMDLILDDISDLLSVAEPSQYTGNRRFDLERFESLVLYVLSKMGTCYKTGLNKILWYIDFGAFKELGTSITGSQYLRWQYGPVPHGYEMLYAGMICKKLIDVDETIKHEQPCENYKSARAPKAGLLRPEELAVADSWIAVLKKKSSRDLKDLSHDEKGYLETDAGKPISYHFANDLRLTPRA